MENIYIPKMTQLKCLDSQKPHFVHNHPFLSCSVFPGSTKHCILSSYQEGKSIFIIAKIVDLKCLRK